MENLNITLEQHPNPQTSSMEIPKLSILEFDEVLGIRLIDEQ
jgi:hypothetical protein